MRDPDAGMSKRAYFAASGRSYQFTACMGKRGIGRRGQLITVRTKRVSKVSVNTLRDILHMATGVSLEGRVPPLAN